MAFTKVSQRTVKCRTCGVRDFYIWADGNRQELRDRDGNEHVGCSASQTPQAPQKRQTVVYDEVDAVAADSDLGKALADYHAPMPAELQALIPDESALRQYVQRKIDGMTDVEMLERAYVANAAHTQGKCTQWCGPKCQRLPINVLLISDTGAGKNALVRAVAAKLRVPYLRVPLNGGATVDGLLGRVDLRNQDGASVTNWQDGRLTLVARHGGIICLDEINACPQPIAFILHPMLDTERTCIIDDHSEAFRISPQAFFVGTMNPDYAGTRTMNMALKSRFSTPLVLDYDDSVEKKLTSDPRLLKIAKQLRASYRTGDGTINKPVGTRDLLNYEQNVSLFGREIGNAAFVSSFDSAEEQVAVKQALDLHLSDATPVNVDADINLDDPNA